MFASVRIVSLSSLAVVLFFTLAASVVASDPAATPAAPATTATPAPPPTAPSSSPTLTRAPSCPNPLIDRQTVEEMCANSLEPLETLQELNTGFWGKMINANANGTRRRDGGISSLTRFRGYLGCTNQSYNPDITGVQGAQLELATLTNIRAEIANDDLVNGFLTATGREDFMSQSATLIREGNEIFRTALAQCK